MDDPQNGSPVDQGPTTSSPRDGGIDFGHYSLEQLQELQYTLDRHSFPQNFENLLRELQRRESAPVPAPPALEIAEPGRFTPRSGLLGWLQAKRMRQPVYGAGSLSVGAAEIVLQGWRRTWLGVAEQATVSVPRDRVRSLPCDESWIGFEWGRHYILRRQVEFRAQSPESAARLRQALPTPQATASDRRWSEVRDFNRRLNQITPRVWVTATLVLMNFGIYIAMALAAGSVGTFDLQQLLRWGANFGVYTVNGQLWRLLTAIFLHANLAHLLLNMWALWNIGRLAERLYGPWMFALLYLSTGLLASLASLAWDLRVAMVGASGAIFGILGAFLAYLMRGRMRVPAAVFRAHWLSTLAFALYNLISGFLEVGIDNAAHVGGLLSGLVLGWMTARPIDVDVRDEFPFKQSIATLLVTAGILLTVLWQLHGVGGRLTVPEQYFRAHQWFVTGETDNLRRWQQIGGSAGAGNISELELGRQFEQAIVPFWETARKRLRTEIPNLPAEQRSLATLTADYADVRHDWAQAVVDAGEKQDAVRARKGVALSKEATLIEARIERIALRASMDHRARTLSNSAPVVAVRNILTTDHRKCVQQPPALGVPTGADDSRQDGPALRLAAGCRAQKLFLRSEYASLESYFEQASTHLGDLPDGGSTLAGIVSGLDELFLYGEIDVQDMLGRTSDWRRSVADPLLADLVEAMLFEDSAWRVRGYGSAKEVSPQAWLQFGYRLEMAAAGLSEIGERGARSPLWYQLSLHVGADQEQSKTQLRATFDRGIDKFPAYSPLYSAMLRILMPRWYGSYEDVDEFINVMSNKSVPRDKILYARLYWMYDSMEHDDISIFEDAKAAWGTVRAGFTEMLTRYPESNLMLNGFAKLACVAGDSEQYAALRPLVAKRPASQAWSQKVTLASCDKKMGAPGGAAHPPASAAR
jgi:membrane associated rhomboid family serine protease